MSYPHFTFAKPICNHILYPLYMYIIYIHILYPYVYIHILYPPRSACQESRSASFETLYGQARTSAGCAEDVGVGREDMQKIGRFPGPQRKNMEKYDEFWQITEENVWKCECYLHRCGYMKMMPACIVVLPSPSPFCQNKSVYIMYTSCTSTHAYIYDSAYCSEHAQNRGRTHFI